MLELYVEVLGAPEGIEPFLEAVARACARLEGICDAEICGRVVGEEEIHRINREFRGVDRPTDVLSFPSVSYPKGETAGVDPRRLRREYNPETGRYFLGDFVISLPRARAQAEEYGHSLERELGYLTAHAMFHLMGYDHEEEGDKALMRAMEERAMRAVNLAWEEERV